ncbi:hypothetical protein D9M71_348110 [compost metagenome]
MLLEAHFLDGVRDEDGQVHLQRHLAGRFRIVGNVERAFVELKRHRLVSAGISKIYDKILTGLDRRVKAFLLENVFGALWIRGLRFIGILGLLRSPSQASQLVSSRHLFQIDPSLVKVDGWFGGAENKKTTFR